MISLGLGGKGKNLAEKEESKTKNRDGGDPSVNVRKVQRERTRIFKPGQCDWSRAKSATPNGGKKEEGGSELSRRALLSKGS